MGDEKKGLPPGSIPTPGAIPPPSRVPGSTGSVPTPGSIPPPSRAPGSIPTPGPMSPSRLGRMSSRPPPASLNDANKEAQAFGGGAVSRPPPSVIPTGKKHVLLVDDDARTRGELAAALRPFYEVHEAGDGLQAAELCTTISPSLVVCDVVMPRLDGFSFAKVLKANPRLSKVPLVFLTSRTGSTDVMQGLSLGARAYIPKPFSTPDVVSKIRKMLG